MVRARRRADNFRLLDLSAIIRGIYKFLKILDSTFFFNVVEDPMERANLKERRKDVYERLVADWYDWNTGMLPEVNESSTGGFTGDQLADHTSA